MKHHAFLMLVGTLMGGSLFAFVTSTASAETKVRFATFNVSLSRNATGQLISEFKAKPRVQPRRVAEVIQRVRPDVLLLNEFDYDPQGQALRLFQDKYLNVSQNGQQPIRYVHHYLASVNTGLPSGLDLDQDGTTNSPNDAFGFGRHPGHYALAVLSRYPIQRSQVRTFQRFLWKDLPGAQSPRHPQTAKPYYPPAIWNKLRLSSKSHWDVPVQTPAGTIHFLVCHPTPPVFDGPEDRNGRRNRDEIRLFADYISPDRGKYVYDDQGRRGGLPAGAKFIIAGDLNADPADGDSSGQAARQLTKHPLIADSQPTSAGGREAKSQGGKNLNHQGDPALDTGDFNDRAVGNLRLDYVLPSRTLKVAKSGVFWPTKASPQATLNRASDHHLVWIDVVK